VGVPDRPADRGAFDPSVLQAMVGDDPVVAEDFARRVVADAAEEVDQLRTAAAAGDAGECARIAHRLRSSARVVGAAGLDAACARVAERTATGAFAEALTDVARAAAALGEAVEAWSGSGGLQTDE
jgi:HPt (histidine-containing phosphotransfer) domain-containing protein